MTLWDLMTALCAVMPLAGALATLRDIQKGWLGYGVAVVVGVVVGLLCAWAMRAVGTALATRSGAGSIREDELPLLYVVRQRGSFWPSLLETGSQRRLCTASDPQTTRPVVQANRKEELDCKRECDHKCSNDSHWVTSD